LVIYEAGDIPKDLKRKRVEEGEEEKKLKLDDVLKSMKSLFEEDKEKEAWERFP